MTAKKPRPRGRPPLPEAERLSAPIRTRYAIKTERAIIDYATSRGIRVAEAVRRLVIRGLR